MLQSRRSTQCFRRRQVTVALLDWLVTLQAGTIYDVISSRKAADFDCLAVDAVRNNTSHHQSPAATSGERCKRESGLTRTEVQQVV